MSRFLFIALSCALLAACTGQTSVQEPVVATQAKPSPAVDVPERRFPNDSLYALLVAEFALRRQAYDVALDHYLEQAPILRDAGVSAHATRLTQFLQREEDALVASQLWVELEPDNAEANNTLAELLARNERSLEALPYLAVVERQVGGANFPIALNGFEQLNEDQRAQLIKGIDELAAEFPQNAQLLLTQALILTESEYYDQALGELQKLFKLEPEQPQALLLEARILIDQKEDNPYKRIERVLKDNPDAQLLRLQYARLLTITDMSAAQQQFEILSARSPRDGDLLFSLALISRESGDNEAARAYLQQLIALGQRVDEAYYSLGSMDEAEDQLEEAIANFERVEESREFLPASNRIGQILVGLKQLDRNHAWFDEQRDKYPRMRQQLFGLEAEILAQAGAADYAVQVLTQALAESPESVALLYGRAMLSEQQGDLAAMETDLRKVLKAEPNNPTALNALGYALANRTTRYPEALELISRALALQPEEPAILDSMGWVLYRNGNYEEAVGYLTRAYAKFPDAEVAAHLGEVLWVKGDTEAALLIWQGALLRDPEHPVMRDTLSRLGVDSLKKNPAPVSPAQSQP